MRNQLYKLPDGRVVKLYDHSTFRPVKMCHKCGRMVSKWHEHIKAKQNDSDLPDMPEEGDAG